MRAKPKQPKERNVKDDGILSRTFGKKHKKIKDTETGKEVSVSHSMLLDISQGLPTGDRVNDALRLMAENPEFHDPVVVVVKTLCLCGSPVLGASWVEMVECKNCCAQLSFPMLIEMRMEELHKAKHASSH